MTSILSNKELIASLENRIFANFAATPEGTKLYEFLNSTAIYILIEQMIVIDKPPISVVLKNCQNILLRQGIRLTRFHSIFISRVISVIAEANGYQKKRSLYGRDIKGLVDQCGIKRAQLYELRFKICSDL